MNLSIILGPVMNTGIMVIYASVISKSVTSNDVGDFGFFCEETHEENIRIDTYG